MRKANIITAFVAVLVLVGFSTLAYKSGVGVEAINFNTPKLQSTEAKLKDVNVKYEKLNTKLDKQTSQDKKTIEILKKEREQLEQQRAELEKQVQARAVEKERLRVAAASAVNTATATRTASAQSYSGSHTDWMAQVGIPQGEWYYVNCIINGCEGVSAEGGWGGVTLWNTTGSGAYGICQSLPAGKMASAGADYMTNPVTQLRWCNSYAQGYGSWAKAWEFRKCTGSCYSPRTNTTVYKDHTWW